MLPKDRCKLADPIRLLHLMLPKDRCKLVDPIRLLQLMLPKDRCKLVDHNALQLPTADVTYTDPFKSVIKSHSTSSTNVTSRAA